MPPAMERRLPPAEVNCKWWMKGYCARGQSCHFKHDDAMFPAQGSQNQSQSQSQQDQVNNKGSPSSQSQVASSPQDHATSQTCAICFETPGNYGLLINCNHAFCLECIRNWRATAPLNPTAENELKKTSKTCPICRSRSDFIIPSSIWPSTGTGENTTKKKIVDGYLGRLKTIPCKHFEQSIKDSTPPDYRFKCQFGNHCHYSHAHPNTKEPYVFSDQELRRRRKAPRRDLAQLLDELAIMDMLFSEAHEWSDEGEEDDFEDRLIFENEFLGISDDFDDFGYDYGWD